MHHITMYLDFVSPYAWLAFQQLPQQLQGLSYHAEYRPILLGAMLQQHGNPGPAGIAPKRHWTYRHVQWQGQQLGIPVRMPAQHPFNPLPLLRLALQTSEQGSINRFVAESIFRHVWDSGEDALQPDRLIELQQQLHAQLRSDPNASEHAKQLLRNNTEQAAALGVFGAPSFVCGHELFWGLESLPMLRAYLGGHPWFQSPAWTAAPPASALSA